MDAVGPRSSFSRPTSGSSSAAGAARPAGLSRLSVGCWALTEDECRTRGVAVRISGRRRSCMVPLHKVWTSPETLPTRDSCDPATWQTGELTRRVRLAPAVAAVRNASRVQSTDLATWFPGACRCSGVAILARARRRAGVLSLARAGPGGVTVDHGAQAGRGRERGARRGHHDRAWPGTGTRGRVDPSAGGGPDARPAASPTRWRRGGRHGCRACCSATPLSEPGGDFAARAARGPAPVICRDAA